MKCLVDCRKSSQLTISCAYSDKTAPDMAVPAAHGAHQDAERRRARRADGRLQQERPPAPPHGVKVTPTKCNRFFSKFTTMSVGHISTTSSSPSPLHHRFAISLPIIISMTMSVSVYKSPFFKYPPAALNNALLNSSNPMVMVASLMAAPCRALRAPGAAHARLLCVCLSSTSSPAAAGASGRKNRSRSAPQLERMRWNVHRAVVEERQPLADVFERLKSEVQARGLRATGVRQAVDTFYFHCARQATQSGLEDPKLRRELLDYLTDELFAPSGELQSFQNRPRGRFVLGESLNEAAFAAAIKLQLAWHDAQAAWTLVGRLLEAAAPAKLHFRTVGPILEHECLAGNFPRAFERWQRLKIDRSVEWTPSMEDTLVQMLVACVSAFEGDRARLNECVEALLHDVQLSSREVSPANAQRLRAAFAAASFDSRVLPSDAAMAPKCPSCRVPLLKFGVSAEERAQLLAAVETRESKVGTGHTAQQHLEPFRDWLLAKHAPAPGKTHYILDGPNIAYINQNFDAGSCRLDQVDLVARRLLAEGHTVSITMPFSYLAETFVLRIRTRKMKEQRKQGRFTMRQRSAREKAIVDAWQRDGLVFSCRTDQLSDDLFWLYASVLLGSECRVITNDRGRDHVAAMLHSDAVDGISLDLIDRWRAETIVNIEIQHEEAPPDGNFMTPIPVEDIRLLHPLPFSRVPQRSTDDHFHLPIAPPESVAPTPQEADAPPVRVRRKWLCMHRPSSSASKMSSGAQ